MFNEGCMNNLLRIAGACQMVHSACNRAGESLCSPLPSAAAGVIMGTGASDGAGPAAGAAAGALEGLMVFSVPSGAICEMPENLVWVFGRPAS